MLGKGWVWGFLPVINAAWEPRPQPGPLWACMDAASSCLRHLLLAVLSCLLGLRHPLKFPIALVPQKGVGEGCLPMVSTAKATRQALGLHGLHVFMQCSGSQPF